MEADAGHSPDNLVNDWQKVFLTAGLLFLPALFSGGGLLFLLVPLLPFLILIREEWQRGLTIVSRAVILAGIAGGVSGTLASTAFAFTQLPVALLLAWSAREHESPVRAGCKAIIGLGCSWLFYWWAAGILADASTYLELQEAIRQGLETSYSQYLASGKVTLEVEAELRLVIDRLQTIVPRLVPALFGLSILSTVWLNLVLGHWLLGKYAASPWPPYRKWRLPETLVWGPIGCGLLLLLPTGNLQYPALNALLLFLLLYFFQGLAVAATILTRWTLPTPLKHLLFLLLLMQVYGVLIFTGLGIFDVWINFSEADSATGRPEKEDRNI